MTKEIGAMPPGLVADWRSLGALIDATHERQPVPFRSGSVLPASFWTSDDMAETELAAEECGRCPVKAACLAYGIEHAKSEIGVYGSLNQSQRRAAARKSTAPERKS